MTPEQGHEPEHPLTGWKEIARFLGCSVRTVQRFERDLGLPVHRTAVSKGAAVRAYPSELTAWLRRDDRRTADGVAKDGTEAVSAPDRRRKQIRIALAAVLAVALGLGAWASFYLRSSRTGTTRATPPGLDLPSTESTRPGDGRIVLTIRPSGGQPVRVAFADKGRADVTLDNVHLTFGGTLVGNNLLLVVRPALSNAAGQQSAFTMKLADGSVGRITFRQRVFEIAWQRVSALPHR